MLQGFSANKPGLYSIYTHHSAVFFNASFLQECKEKTCQIKSLFILFGLVALMLLECDVS
jgi:hypothetical protein